MKWCLQICASRQEQKSAYSNEHLTFALSHFWIQAIDQICLVIPQYVREESHYGESKLKHVLGRGKNKAVRVSLRPICNQSTSCMYFTASEKDSVPVIF